MTPDLFNLGDFTLASGKHSHFLIDCDALSARDWEALAFMLAGLLPPFGPVEGVPRGGLALAEAMRRHATEGCSTLLLTDDVYTSGGSMERHRAGRDAIGAVVFARGPVAPWVTPLFAMTQAK